MLDLINGTYIYFKNGGVYVDLVHAVIPVCDLIP